MTATERLRALLDERRVEWKDEESEIDHVTTWKANDCHAVFYESKTTNPDFLQVDYYNLTPEQAVEATLGMGTCRSTSEWINEFKCSECGFEYDFISDPYKGPRYCPNCGRKVVDA